MHLHKACSRPVHHLGTFRVWKVECCERSNWMFSNTTTPVHLNTLLLAMQHAVVMTFEYVEPKDSELHSKSLGRRHERIQAQAPALLPPRTPHAHLTAQTRGGAVETLACYTGSR